MTDSEHSRSSARAPAAPSADQGGVNAQGEEITSLEGIPALSLDAISSVAYGPEAMLVVLASAGAGALGEIEPITAAIVVLLVILVLSYRQVITAYPGGGCYAVLEGEPRSPDEPDRRGGPHRRRRAHRGRVDRGRRRGVCLRLFLGSDSLVRALAILAALTALNLRGLATSSRVLLLPTAVFIVGISVVIVSGLLRQHPAVGSEVPQTVVRTASTVGVLLILKAFAAGCSALTGKEAIANDVPVFRQPRARRAMRTGMLLGALLATMLLGHSVLTVRFRIPPSTSATVLSQVTRASVGSGRPTT